MVPKTPRGKHSESAGNPSGRGSRKSGGFTIFGRITKKLLVRRSKGGWNSRLK